MVLYDRVDTSFSYMNEETELFKVVHAQMNDTMEEFVHKASEAAMKQIEYFNGPIENDVIVYSAIPWISFTHISHTNSGIKECATPIIDVGKYYEKNGILMMPFSVQVHHSFGDGFHVGKLVSSLQLYLNSFNCCNL